MIIFRFMSKNEIDLLMSGKSLVNNRTFSECRTASTGFCFLDAEEYTIEHAYDFLSGIVSDYVCVMFETDAILEKSSGTYAITCYDDVTDEEYYNGKIARNEYCIDSYSLQSFHPVAFFDVNDDVTAYATIDEFRHAHTNWDAVEDLYYELDNSNDYINILNTIKQEVR